LRHRRSVRAWLKWSAGERVESPMTKNATQTSMATTRSYAKGTRRVQYRLAWCAVRMSMLCSTE
jgi:hypothetical protein